MTPSEMHVAQLAAQGLSNAVIARRRGTSVRTVANQMAQVLAKLGVASRRALAVHDAVVSLPAAEGAAAPCWDALTARQRAVVSRASAGTPQKVVAIELGVSESAVSVMLRASRQRLGIATHAEMARAAARTLR